MVVSYVIIAYLVINPKLTFAFRYPCMYYTVIYPNPFMLIYQN